MSIKEKLQNIIDNLLSSSRIPGMYRPIIKGMIDNYMKEVTEEQMKAYILEFRDKFIPWLLDGAK